MNPDKLFDYLDGKLSPADREQLEEKLMSEPQLRRQFEVAREIHRSGGNTREVVRPIDDPAESARAGKLGRRIATAAIVLVFMNVVLGLAFIAGKNKKSPAPSAQEAAIRQQLTASLGAAGENALPTPTFVEDEIRLSAPRQEWEAVAAKVIAAAEQCGGSGARGLPDKDVSTVVVDVPSSRKEELRRLLVPGGPSPSPAPANPVAPENVSPNERTIVQVRITEAAR